MSSTNEEYVEGIYLNDGTLKKFKDADLTQKVAELNSNFKNKYIQSGVTSTINANGYYRFATITFPTAYESTPNVVVSAVDSGHTALYAGLVALVCNVTKTGFEISIGKPDGGLENTNINAHWIAVGKIS